ncbi:MAG: hypothetical protein AAFQ87_08085 [Bacteroidota bacterium]
MMRYLIVLLCCCTLLACVDDSPSGERTTPSSIPSLEDIRYDFRVRLADTNHMSLPEAKLLTSLPALFAPYQERNSDQTSLGGFSQCRAVYQLGEGGYLAIKLSDYGQDSSAFLHLYQQYLQIENADLPMIEGRKIPLSLAKAFGWAWKDRQSEIQYLAAGVDNRFYVQLQTNRPSGLVALEDAIRRIEWDKLRP